MADEIKPAGSGDAPEMNADEALEQAMNGLDAMLEETDTEALPEETADADMLADIEKELSEPESEEPLPEETEEAPAPAAPKPKSTARPAGKRPEDAIAAALAKDAAQERKAEKAAKKVIAEKKKKRSIEDEIKALEEEEKLYDEWGRPIRKKRRKVRRKKSRKLSCTLVLLTLILASASVLSVAILAVAKEMYGIDKDVQDRVINIPEGSTTVSIAEQLVDEKMISLPQVFRLVSRMNNKDGDYIAGEHVLRASMSYEAMIEELCTNYVEERDYVRVVFPEGITLMDAAKTLQENEVCNADDFIFWFNKGGYGFEFENHLPATATNSLKFQRMEGYCFPDTYEFYVGESPDIVAQKIYANFDSKITEGDYRKMEELGMTLDEVVTLASIVQGEAPSADSMRKVASVFHNRLLNRAEFSKLQSDPTRKYAEDVIAPNLEINNELMLTAYNTYEGQGLPPGAINNPGKDAIEATLYPEDTPYYYFNANIDTKQIYYAVTYEEHLANLARVEQEYAEAEALANGEAVGGNG